MQDDPRQRGFSDRATLAQLSAWIDGSCPAQPPVEIPTAGAAGRVLAADLVVPADLPPAPTALRDGLAIRAADSFGAGGYNPILLTLDGGTGPLPPAAARPVAAGGKLPAGADAVLDYGTAGMAGGMVELLAQAAGGEGMVPAGADAAAGAVAVPRGQRLRGIDLALARAAGREGLAVHPSPRVMLIAATGDADGPALLLEPAIRRDGGTLVGAVAAVGEGALSAALDRVAGAADLAILVGACGLDADHHAPAALARVGRLEGHGLALRPGDTAGWGRMGGVPVLLLPEAPGVLRLAWEVTGARAVRRLAGLPPEPPLPRRARPLAQKLSSDAGWDELVPARLLPDRRIQPTGRDVLGPGSLARAAGFVWIPTDSEGFPEGAEAHIYLFDC